MFVSDDSFYFWDVAPIPKQSKKDGSTVSFFSCFSCSGKKLYSKDEWNAAFLGFDAIREAAKKANGFIIDPASVMYAVPNAPVSKQKDKNADA